MYVVRNRFTKGTVGSYFHSKSDARKQLLEIKKRYPNDSFYIGTIVYPKNKRKARKTQGTKVSGKLIFTGRTSSGKGTVKGYVTGRKGRNAKSIVVSRTSYRTSNGQRRVLEIVTTKKVIKA